MRRAWSLIVWTCLLSCEDAGAPSELASTPMSMSHTDLALAVASEDEKLAEDVERALSRRWGAIAEILLDCPRPLLTTEDILRQRGLPDLEAELPLGVFHDDATRNRYFAGLLLGWMNEDAALKIVARVEARRLHSLIAARAELPDVDQRLLVDELARASSARLHAICRRLPSCEDALLPSAPELGPKS